VEAAAGFDIHPWRCWQGRLCLHRERRHRRGERTSKQPRQGRLSGFRFDGFHDIATCDRRTNSLAVRDARHKTLWCWTASGCTNSGRLTSSSDPRTQHALHGRSCAGKEPHRPARPAHPPRVCHPSVTLGGWRAVWGGGGSTSPAHRPRTPRLDWPPTGPLSGTVNRFAQNTKSAAFKTRPRRRWSKKPPHRQRRTPIDEGIRR
jgi:hypothetical protein